MLSEIHIAGHAKYADPARSLAALLEQHPGRLHAVVITDPGVPCPWVTDKVKSCLHLTFDDVHERLESSGRIPPAREHVHEVLSWADGKDAVAVACHAGVSRSAATAFLIASWAWGVARALGVLRAGVHLPNPALVRVMADMFPGEGIADAVERWTNDTLRTLLTEAETPPDPQR